MGHSTVSFIVKNFCNSAEIAKEYNSKCDDDRERYGYEENCNSYSKATTPSTRYLNPYKAYTPKAIEKINIDSYESFVMYIFPQEEMQKLFAKVYIKVKKVNEEISKLKNELAQKIKEIKQKPQTKTIFYKCSSCKSLINMNLYKTFREPSQCPICSSTENNTFGANWSNKLYGKSKLKLEQKYEAKINKLVLKRTELDKQIPETIEITPKNKSKIWTLFMADVHH